ncbi:hypothetical protein [Limimaricola pyoseonensis]|uniref:MYXO-CTERM domain-containing protein n=1 Tax=Limimaricola pyoseonensis TaxID=521013 RepID=A0A1G7KRU1_9RHOB|nr:hypothetical protein [Limimaricola pyoseonensis]SDF39794.1 MYXO-CTERM domain-containing protein [Limimaricola pyoseonensis]
MMTRILLAAPALLPAPALAHAGHPHGQPGWTGPLAAFALIGLAGLAAWRRARS